MPPPLRPARPAVPGAARPVPGRPAPASSRGAPVRRPGAPPVRPAAPGSSRRMPAQDVRSSQRQRGGPAPAKKSSLPLILGIAGGVLALAIAGFLMMGPKKGTAAGAKKKKPGAAAAAVEKPDVRDLLLQGKRLADEGLTKGREAVANYEAVRDGGGDKQAVAAELQAAHDLLHEGMAKLDEAYQINDEMGVDTKDYGQMMKSISMILRELR